MRRFRAQLLLGAFLSAHVALLAVSGLASPLCCETCFNCPMHCDRQDPASRTSCLGETRSSICVCGGGNHILPVLRLDSFQAVRTKTLAPVVAFVIETEVQWFDPGPASNGFAGTLELPPRL